MRNPKCCVCNSKRQDAFLHYFPVRDTRKTLQWLNCVNLEFLHNLPKKKLAQQTVCHIHFEKRFTKSNEHLRYGAYPSLFTPEEINSGVSSRQFVDISVEYQHIPKRHSDHTYCKNEEPKIKIQRTTAVEYQHIPKRHSDHTYCKNEEPRIKIQRTTASGLTQKHAVQSSLIASTIHPTTSFQVESLASSSTESDAVHSSKTHISSIQAEALASTSTESDAVHSSRSHVSTIQAEALASTSTESDAGHSSRTHVSTIQAEALASTSTESDAVHSSRTRTHVSTIQAEALASTSTESDAVHSSRTHVSTIQAEALASTSTESDAVHSSRTHVSTIQAEGLTHRDAVECSKAGLNIQSSTCLEAKGQRVPIHKTPKASRKRLISKVVKLSPTCRKLYNEYKKAKLQVDYQKRANRALKFAKHNSFEDLTKNMNPYAKQIMQMQIKLYTKKKRARRFTDQEKLIALSIMKQSPKCYRFLQKIFVLPSKSTLNKLITNMHIEVGINPVLVEVMKKEVTSWDQTKKYCSLIFDEMHLDDGLHYDQHKDRIDGFVCLDKKDHEFADQALVFMLRGAIAKWQQAFAFYFCKGTVKPAVLKKIIKDIVAAVIEIGLHPVATICDQGSTFRRALEELQQETRRKQLLEELPTDETVGISGVNLSVFYDPSHLIKGLRNNFLNKDIKLDGKLSKWKDIVDVYLTDCSHMESRLLHKLNDHDVLPEKMDNRKKMKVKAAARVLSSTVSAALSYTSKFTHYTDGRPVSATMSNTAETVKFLDNLHDSMNGASLHHKRAKKELRKAVTTTSKHESFWTEAIKKLDRMEFIDASGNKVSVPTLKSCITTLKSYKRLWQFFKNQGLKVMRPRYFNSDPIENFFGQVRAYNFRYNDPDCHSFICTFRSLLITRMMNFHSNTFNCESDQADQLLSLAEVLRVARSKNTSQSAEQDPAQSDQNLPDCSQNSNDMVTQARAQRLQIHSRAYTCGWVVKKVLKQNPCKACKKKLTCEKELPIHVYVSHREFKDARKLTYPSEQAVRCFGTLMKETNTFLETSPHVGDISKNVLVAIKSNDLELTCPTHKTSRLFEECVVKLAIFNWIKIINKILKGSDTERLRSNNLLPMQKKAFDKMKKKINKKR